MFIQKFFRRRFLFFLLISHTVLAQNQNLSSSEADNILKNSPLFPNMYFTEAINNLLKAEFSKPYWVRTKEEQNTIDRVALNQVPLLLNDDVLAFYGHPSSRNMGILGRYTIEELDQKLTELTFEYAAFSGGRTVRKAFYIIYGTVWPKGEIGILNNEILMRYIEYGLNNNILVFIDHQIGCYDPVDSLKKMLPYLHYPNVHLALDPEWRTTKPMEVIGTISAEELNRAQQVMEDYIIENNLPGERLLVIHQFNWAMIKNRSSVKSNFYRVRLVHCADGFGPPNQKIDSYAYNATATNMPVKGFKLFFNFGITGAGYDYPLMTPKEVYALTPRPYVIMYQ